MLKKFYSSFFCVFVIHFVWLIPSTSLYAEGTAEVAPNSSITVFDGTTNQSTNDRAALFINHDAYGNFAYEGNTDRNSRLYFHISDVHTEIVYLGFSRANSSYELHPDSLFSRVRFRIMAPDGTHVTNWGPHNRTGTSTGNGYQRLNSSSANISSHAAALAGPNTVTTGTGGYTPFTFDPSALGLSQTGDYYIEFLNSNDAQPFLIEWWDITVATEQGGLDTPIPGRVWAYNWSFFAPNDYGFPNRPFNGSFHVMAPALGQPGNYYVTRLDFDGAGFQPAAFNVAFNSTGTSRTDDVVEDRKSFENGNSTTPEYRVFLNDPDINIWPSGTFGAASFDASATISRCAIDDVCINVRTSEEGQIDVLLDLDGDDGIYTPGTKDRVIAAQITSADFNSTLGEYEKCVEWDALDGLDSPVTGVVNVILDGGFSQGIYHFPIYDAEYMKNGFTVQPVRPSGTTPQLYWDDQNISKPSTGSAETELNGCSSACHAWNNYSHADTVGFGNLNTINTWWFANRAQISSTTLSVPDYLVADAGGDLTVCQGVASIPISGSITYAGSGSTISNVEWVTSGDGTFSPNNTSSDAFYYPGPQDKVTNGMVDLTFQATGDCSTPEATVRYTFSSDVGTCTSFPVELLGFEVELIGKDGFLSWNTASEINNDYFQVERSMDGQDFEAIGNLKGAGTTLEANSYQFTDAQVALIAYPTVYYRLKQVDFDGQFTYSKTLELNTGLENLFTVFPNPASETVNVRYELLKENILMVITNSLGQVMTNRQVKESSGLMHINVSSWPAGIYYMQSLQGEESHVYKFVVSH